MTIWRCLLVWVVAMLLLLPAGCVQVSVPPVKINVGNGADNGKKDDSADKDDDKDDDDDDDDDDD